METVLSAPDSWVDIHGDHLFRYALQRLHELSLAEDMVQETFLAAFRQKETFAGRSSERTWLVGILKHKIIDHFRRVNRERSLNDSETTTDFLDENFRQGGALPGTWKTGARPAAWAINPSDELDKKELRSGITHCLSKLDQRHQEAFVLREMEDLDSAEISDILRISPVNLRVILHRCRTRLRRCLERFLPVSGGK